MKNIKRLVFDGKRYKLQGEDIGDDDTNDDADESEEDIEKPNADIDKKGNKEVFIQENPFEIKGDKIEMECQTHKDSFEMIENVYHANRKISLESSTDAKKEKKEQLKNLVSIFPSSFKRAIT